jgi:hypothetical protein
MRSYQSSNVVVEPSTDAVERDLSDELDALADRFAARAILVRGSSGHDGVGRDVDVCILTGGGPRLRVRRSIASREVDIFIENADQWDTINVAALAPMQIAGMSSYTAIDDQTLSQFAPLGLLSSLTNLTTLTDSTLLGMSGSVLTAFSDAQLDELTAPDQEMAVDAATYRAIQGAHGTIINISVGIQNAQFPWGGNVSLGAAHTYIVLYWSDGTQTVLQTGPSGPYLLSVDYPNQIGANQQASASNGETGLGTVFLAFSSPAQMNTFGLGILNAYTNFNTVSVQSPLIYGSYWDNPNICNATTYNGLLAAGINMSVVNDVFQALANQSGLTPYGGTFDIDVLGMMLDPANEVSWNLPDLNTILDSPTPPDANGDGEAPTIGFSSSPSGATLDNVPFTDYYYDPATNQYVDQNGNPVDASVVSWNQQENEETGQNAQNLGSGNDPYGWTDESNIPL